MTNKNRKTRALQFPVLAGMTLLCQLFASPSVFGQLTLFANKGQAGSSGTCVVNTIYTDASIPGGLNNDISSISLQQGYMTTLAENSDGSGEAYTFIAAVSNIAVDLNPLLDNKVSFIRVLPFRNTLKKGAGLQNNAHIDQLNVSWFYDWGALDVSLPGREYAMMSWGRQGANATNIANYISKPDVTHLLSFNEPDNTDQSNIPVAEAVTLHKNLAQTGLRLGSPAPTESQAFVWLTNFMAGTRQQQIKVDYVAVHWYDWSSYLSTNNPAPNPNDVFTRFKNYINYVYSVYGKPIWITEFNANRNTTSATHEQFIALALPWLEAQPYVERYAYFFPPALPPVDGSGNITAIGRAYRDFAGSTAAITKNYDNTELLTTDVNSVKEGENAILYNPSVSNTTPTCATASGGLMAAAVTGSNRIGFHEINVPVAGNYKVEVSYFAKTGRNMTTRVNHGTPQVTALAASGNWCFEGGSPGLFEITVSLLAGNNSIEFTESPIIDFVKVKDNGLLPVSLLTFSGKLVNKSAELEWRTAQEQNSKHFDVLRSTDGNRFAYIGRVQAAGNSATANNYLFTDRDPSGGMNFYKLKAVDKDGSFTYSNTIAIKNDSRTAALSFLSATLHSVRISAYSTGNEMATANLLSVDGKVLATQKLLLKSGLNVFEIPNRISKGNLGLITLHTSNAMHSVKFMW